MDLQAGEGTGGRSLAIVQPYRGAGVGRQRFRQRLIQRDVNAHTLYVMHPAGRLFRLQRLTVRCLLPRQDPGIAAGGVRREDLTREGIEDHRCIDIHRRVTQALFTKINDNIGIIVGQRQHDRRHDGIDPRIRLQVTNHTVSFGAHLGPGRAQLRFLQRIMVFLQNDVTLVVVLTALDQQVLDLRIQHQGRLLTGLPGGLHPVEVELQGVLHRTQALVAIECDLIVTGDILYGAQIGADSGDLCTQLLVAQSRLLEDDPCHPNFINGWRWVEPIQQIALFHLAVVVHVNMRNIAGDPQRYQGHRTHHGGARCQRDLGIGSDKSGKYSQRSGGIHPYPADKFLFRRRRSVLDLVILFVDIP